MRVVHIGLGKSATSSLQAHVFPRLAEGGAIGSYNPPDIVQKLDGILNGWLTEADIADDWAAAGDVLVSNETLVDWDPSNWEIAADRLHRILGPDTVILLTLREPESYLRSLYQQMLHSGKIRSPHDAFLPTAIYKSVRRFVRPGEMDMIDIDAFDLSRLIEIYRTRFQSVFLLPVENLAELRFLMMLWSVSETDREVLARTFAKAPRINTSYSRLAVRLTLFRERLLTGLGLRSRSTTDSQLQRALDHARRHPFSESRRLRLPSWNRVMRFISRYGPKTAYALPQDLYLGEHRASNAAIYTALRAAPEGYVVIRNGHYVGYDLHGAATVSAKES